MRKEENPLKLLPEHGPCFICGSENPCGIGLRWYADEKGIISSEFTLTLSQQGPPGHSHGGATAAIIDEVMGSAVWQEGYRVVAAKIEINYRKPVPLDVPLIVTGKVTRRSGRKVYARGEIYLRDGGMLVHGKGLFIEALHLFEGTNMFKER